MCFNLFVLLGRLTSFSFDTDAAGGHLVGKKYCHKKCQKFTFGKQITWSDWKNGLVKIGYLCVWWIFVEIV